MTNTRGGMGLREVWVQKEVEGFGGSGEEAKFASGSWRESENPPWLLCWLFSSWGVVKPEDLAGASMSGFLPPVGSLWAGRSSACLSPISGVLWMLLASPPASLGPDLPSGLPPFPACVTGSIPSGRPCGPAPPPPPSPTSSITCSPSADFTSDPAHCPPSQDPTRVGWKGAPQTQRQVPAMRRRRSVPDISISGSSQCLLPEFILREPEDKNAGR